VCRIVAIVAVECRREAIDERHFRRYVNATRFFTHNIFTFVYSFACVLVDISEEFTSGIATINDEYEHKRETQAKDAPVRRQTLMAAVRDDYMASSVVCYCYYYYYILYIVYCILYSYLYYV
jgi:hypothetical protein